MARVSEFLGCSRPDGAPGGRARSLHGASAARRGEGAGSWQLSARSRVLTTPLAGRGWDPPGRTQWTGAGAHKWVPELVASANDPQWQLGPEGHRDTFPLGLSVHSLSPSEGQGKMSFSGLALSQSRFFFFPLLGTSLTSAGARLFWVLSFGVSHFRPFIFKTIC